MKSICRAHFPVVFLTLFLTQAGLQQSSAQPLLWSDAGIQQGRGGAPSVPDLRANVPDTLTITATSPFFDDFSYTSPLPDTNKWFIPSIDFRVPGIVRNSAEDAPTPGTLRFDGLRRSNIPYETLTLLSGPTDRLVSHYLDISAWDPGDNVWLYLYLEPGGLCEAPEARDSLNINLITPLDTFLLASATGEQTTGSWLAIPLDQSGFFTPLSQLVLESFGSQNGLLDVWLVDYLYLGPEWSGGVTNLNEKGPVRLLSSPVEPYFQLPQVVYQQGNSWQKIHEIAVKNNSLAPFSGSLHAEWSSSLTPPNSPYFYDVNLSFAANSSAATSIPAAGTQNPQQPGSWHVISYLNNNSDRFAGNDTLRVAIGIDSLIGYDDGIPDGTYGLNKSLGFGLRFDLPARDTIEAVWMNFSPLVYANPVNGKLTYLDGKVFRLRFWDFPHPDSFFVEQVAGMEVTYEEQSGYVRFPLGQPVEVPTKFWVGLQQLDDVPIGLGFDASYDRDAWSYWDSLGTWTNTSLNGVPMIRLEVASGNAGGPASIDSDSRAFRQVSIRPNPVIRGEKLTVSGTMGTISYRAELISLQGQVVASIDSQQPENEISFRFPEELPAGLYLWRHEAEFNGQTSISVERLVVH